MKNFLPMCNMCDLNVDLCVGAMNTIGDDCPLLRKKNHPITYSLVKGGLMMNIDLCHCIEATSGYPGIGGALSYER